MRREQVGNLNAPVAIRPQAAPSHSPVSVAAARPVGADLAQALAGFSNDLSGYLMQMEQEDQKEALVAAHDTINGMTFDQAKAMVDSGQIPEHENPYFVAAFKKQFGLAYAAERKRHILSEYLGSGFDRENGDIDAFLTGFYQEDQQTYGGDEFIADGIREGMGNFRQTLMNQQAQAEVQQMQTEVRDRFFTVASDTVTRAVAAGQNPLMAVRSLYRDHNQLLGLSFAEMDDVVMQLAEGLAAEGNYEAVRDLLTTEVTGRDGTGVGSFVNKRTTGVKAQRLLQVAQARDAENWRRDYWRSVGDLQDRASEGGLTDADGAVIDYLVQNERLSPSEARGIYARNQQAAQEGLLASRRDVARQQYMMKVASLVNNGYGFAIKDFTFVDPEDPNQRPHTFKAKETLQLVVNSVIADMGANGKTVGEQAAWLASRGIDVKVAEWESMMNHGYTSIHPGVAEVGPDGQVTIPQPALRGYEMWKSLGEFGALRGRHVSDPDAAELYGTAEVLERNGHGVEDALVTAMRAQNGQLPGTNREIDRGMLLSQIDDYLDNGWSDDVVNQDIVRREVEALAETYMKLGLGMEPAIEEATRVYEEGHSIVHGISVNTRNFLVPENFEEMSTPFVENFAFSHEEDPEDLAMVPTPGGRYWMVVRKGNLQPDADWLQQGIISLAEINAQHEARLAPGAAEEAAAAEAEVLGDNERIMTRKRAFAALEGLPPRHRVNHFQFAADSDEYLDLQRRFGRELYPDGGLIDQSIPDGHIPLPTR